MQKPIQASNLRILYVLQKNMQQNITWYDTAITELEPVVSKAFSLNGG